MLKRQSYDQAAHLVLSQYLAGLLPHINALRPRSWDEVKHDHMAGTWTFLAVHGAAGVYATPFWERSAGIPVVISDVSSADGEEQTFEAVADFHITGDQLRDARAYIDAVEHVLDGIQGGRL